MKAVKRWKEMAGIGEVGILKLGLTKASLAVLVIAFSLLLLQALSVSSIGGDTDWRIEGDCVRWNNTKGDINVCPHTITQSGWVNVELTSHFASSQDLTLAFGISEGLSVSKPQIWANINHPYLVGNCTRVTVEVNNNGTPENINETICNPYTADNYYDDWQSVGSFSQSSYDGKTWYLRDATWNSGETKTARVWVDVVPRSGRNKYYVFMKKASDTIAQAVSNGNYVLLDPWVDSPPTVFNETFDNGNFVDASRTNLNISRGWLILNASGANETNILLNTSAAPWQNCWNSSADPTYSTTLYNCLNLQDGALTLDTTDVWATAGAVSSPEYVAFELADTYWLQNFSFYVSISGQDGRNPANWSAQLSPTAPNRTAAAGPGSDTAADWVYAQFNRTNLAGNAPDADGIVFGPARAKALRWHITDANDLTSQPYISEVYAYRSTFNTSGQLTSVLLNDTVVIDMVSITCVNSTGNSSEVGMNITVMDKNYENEQSVVCNSNSASGFENDINNIEGLIYRINFSSRHSGITPELDFLTIRVTEAGGTGATESEGDVAIEAGINDSLPSGTKYKTQKVYVVNAGNTHRQGTVDYLLIQDNPPRRWLFNYITTGESYLNTTNMSNVVYILELANKTFSQIRNEVKIAINLTKG